ncbi:DUF397 domain-containing protein [Streptomyces sp. JJ38]|uniref:DUF397 domain-containing protein n=1 Tax=Streptomyces sp. JJ38 TaxID=2738128 RepID=UPI001C59350A|nr:DUF397 domain-containing protein [Streptomyces sp. JJ38]MBW1597881.1 DUF397 domain-containing protein [Streptomyces sp. JJ38]
MKSEHDLRTARWRKSSYSGGSGGDCIEVADGVPGVVPVRDSKALNRHPLLFGAAPWEAFVTAATKNTFRPF